VLLFFVVINSYSQQVLQSSQQENCLWDVTSSSFAECTPQEKEYQISINQNSSIISVTYLNEVDIYKIKSKEISTNQTIFHTIHASGIGSIITFNSLNNWIQISDEPITKRTQFYLNN
jgi:hypothetical protein